MSFKVAFWNINMGPGSPQTKQDAFKAWCADHKPDLLCLEEDSFASGAGGPAALEGLTGMTYINHVETLNINDQPCGKNLVALSKVKDAFAARPLQFPEFGVGDARRMLLKVTTKDPADLALWVIHANASKSGGNVAAAAVKTYLGKAAGSTAVVGGDFNHAFEGAGWAASVAPHAWDAASSSKFTQWNQEANSFPKTDADYAALMLDKAKGVLNIGVKPGMIIDYAACGAGRTLTALPSMTYSQWATIICNFDHAPVLFQVA
jgi:hypothetical protein